MTRKYSSIKDHGFWNPDATVTVTNNPIDLIKDLQIEIEDLKSRLKESDEQNERYEKALEFYADVESWTITSYNNSSYEEYLKIQNDDVEEGIDKFMSVGGKRAREALKE